MRLAIVDFAALTTHQLAAAGRVLREASAHLPSGYQSPGEAEAEIEVRRNAPDWIGFAGLKQHWFNLEATWAFSLILVGALSLVISTASQH